MKPPQVDVAVLASSEVLAVGETLMHRLAVETRAQHRPELGRMALSGAWTTRPGSRQGRSQKHLVAQLSRHRELGMMTGHWVLLQ